MGEPHPEKAHSSPTGGARPTIPIVHAEVPQRRLCSEPEHVQPFPRWLEPNFRLLIIWTHVGLQHIEHGRLIVQLLRNVDGRGGDLA
jgi:hypothetical protein